MFLNAPNSHKRQAKAQSMVEFAITLPVLILILTGLVEFGFMLNTYLSLQDAARTAARRYSGVVPFNDDGSDNPAFYSGTAEYVTELLAPAGDPDSRQIVMDSTRDNVLVSLVGVDVDDDTGSITDIVRYSGAEYYKHFGDTDPPSVYTDAAISDMVTAGGATPADAGLLIVEVYYGYEGTLNLPWTQPFFSPGNPSMMYISVVMPTIYVKPFDDHTP